MNQQRKDQILEKVAGLPSPLKGRLVQSLKSFSPEIRKSVLHGAPVPQGAENLYGAAMKAARGAATSPAEAAQLQSHLMGRKAAGKISRTTFFPKTRAEPLIQQGRAAKQGFKQLRAQEQLDRANFRRNLGIGAGGLGLAGLGYLALKGRAAPAVPEEEMAVAAPSESWG